MDPVNNIPNNIPKKLSKKCIYITRYNSEISNFYIHSVSKPALTIESMNPNIENFYCEIWIQNGIIYKPDGAAIVVKHNSAIVYEEFWNNNRIVNTICVEGYESIVRKFFKYRKFKIAENKRYTAKYMFNVPSNKKNVTNGDMEVINLFPST